MIRNVNINDAKDIADIYNKYIADTTITFETERLRVAEMEKRIKSIAAVGPYFIYMEEGKLCGYCYAHPWKERAAYANTFETTIYLAPGYENKGIGTQLMRRLIADCHSRDIHALIACITEGNAASNHLHEKLGFRQVSHFRQVGRKFDRWLDVVDYELILE
jgi:L-amino acid N-acyltransferase YncA